MSGDDSDKFKVTPVVGASTTLEFKDKPDFENPGDMNDDNVYEVTVVASDGANPATRDVTVKVTNMEELGKIEVMPAQPRVGSELTAELTAFGRHRLRTHLGVAQAERHNRNLPRDARRSMDS